MGEELPDRSAQPDRSANVRNTLITLLAILAIFNVCLSIGQQRVNPFAPVSLSRPSHVVRTPSGYVVADMQSKRLLFCNEDLKIRNIAGLEVDSSPLHEATVIVGGTENDVYVAGVSEGLPESEATTESLVRYSSSGILLNVLWTMQYEPDANRPRRVFDVNPTPKGIYLVMATDDASTLSLALLAPDESEPEQGASELEPIREYAVGERIYDACYDPETDRLCASDIHGCLYVESPEHDSLEKASVAAEGGLVTSIDDAGEGTIVAAENSSACVWRLDLASGEAEDLGLSHAAAYGVDVGAGTLGTVYRTGGAALKDLAGGEAKYVRGLSLSFEFFSWHITLFVSVLYLVALLIVIAVRGAARKLRNGERLNVSSVLVTALTVLAIAAGITYATYNLYAEKAQTREQEVKTFASYMCDMGPSMLPVADSQTTGDEKFQQLSNSLDSLSQQAFNRGIYLYSYIYSVNDAGELVYSRSSRGDIVQGERVTDVDVSRAVAAVQQAWKDRKGMLDQRLAAAVSSIGIAERSDAESRRTYAMAPLVQSDGRCVGVLEIGSHTESFLQEQSVHLFDYLLTYVVTAIGMYLVIREIRAAGKAFEDYRNLREGSCEWASSVLVRPMLFLLLVSGSIDAIFSVVIGREMLASYGPQAQSNMFLLSLPGLAASLGGVLGSLFYRNAATRKSGRVIALGSLAVALVGQTSCLFAAWQNQFVWFALSQLVFEAGNSVAISATYALVSRIDDGERQGQTYVDCRVCSMSSGVVSSLLAGFITTVTDAGNIYIVGIVTGILAFVLFLRGMPLEWKCLNEEKMAPRSEIKAFLRQPFVTATVLFAGIPYAIASGYRVLIFPLLMTSSGMTEAQMANLFVVGESVLLLLSNSLYAFRHIHGYWMSVVVGIFGIGITLIIVGPNQTVGWAVAAIVILNVFYWFAGRWNGLVRKWGREDWGIADEQIELTMDFAKRSVKSTEGPLISFFLRWGTALGCFGLGALCSVCGLLYIGTTRKQRDRRRLEAQE